MTMSTLLSHFGLDAERYVTTSGQVVFGGVTTSAAGLTHATHGPVTSVANHTFHGGDDPVDGGHDHWWSDDVKAVRHIVAMKQAFPGFKYVRGDDDIAPYWLGDIDTGRGVFTIGVFLRRDEGLPFVTVISKQPLGRPAGRRFVRSPHLYDSGSLCIADQSDWDPTVHTAATATAWAAHWLAAFTEWRITLKWPVDGVHVAA
ncbi:hypothetical protein [Nocardioides rubriscoriae]|uniref:hypothetical protein n=1 Tax=Nocardioides rubriscoriae TaxID=642762 RepID=UPI0011E03B2B|nr:hypothetical protein [Nocardioides rubriscoriae]